MMESEDLPDAMGPDAKKAFIKETGLYPKYDVINKAAGTLVTEPVFVLKPDSDPHARAAIRAYAHSCRVDGYLKLADDLEAWSDTGDDSSAQSSLEMLKQEHREMLERKLKEQQD